MVLHRWMRFLVDWLPRTLLPLCVVIYSRVERPATTAGSLLVIKMLTHLTLRSGYGRPGVLLVYVEDPWCLSRIPGSNFSTPDPGSWSASSNFSILTQNLFLSSRKYDPGSSSRIPDPDLDFLPIPDPGSRILDPGVKKAPDPGSWIRIRNPAFGASSRFRFI